MLTLRRSLLTLACAVLVATGCTSESARPTPTTVSAAVASDVNGVMTVRVGAIVNTAAPTAERDERLVDVLLRASESAATGAAVDIEVMRINDVDDVASAVRSLAGEGVTVIAALCDDATVPATVEETVASGLLAITACVSLPTPPLGSTSPMFVDLAGLHDAAGAMATWTEELGAQTVATFRSDLIDDIETTCLDVEASLAELDIALSASVTFTELVDDPLTVVAETAPLLDGADVIALCALPPTVGDVIGALRSAGHDQPVVVPWFADDQLWPTTVSDVHVIAPASRYGDDPEDAVNTMLVELGPSAEAADVVAADSVAMLSQAAQRAGSVGSMRLATALRDGTTTTISGALSLIDGSSQTAGRSYRAVSIENGIARFEALVRWSGE